MIRIGTIWDRTTEVIAGRGGILAVIAIALLFAPNVAQAAVAALAADNSALKAIAGLLTLAVLVLAIWGSLALTAVASDPAVGRRDALEMGRARLGAGLGVTVILIVAVLLALVPGLALVVASGFDFAKAQATVAQTAIDAGTFGLAMLWFVVIGLVMLCVGARLTPLMPVVANERRGVGAFARAFALTRGSTLRLIGVLILYVIVFLVVLAAATAIFGLIARLLVGPESPAIVGFVTAIATAAASAVFGVIQNVFSAQFYLAARAIRDAA